MLNNSDAPIFIIGNPRSGTTMFRLMLTCHPHIGIPPEAGWIIELYDKYHNVVIKTEIVEEFISDLLETSKIEEWHFDRTNLSQELHKICPVDFATTCSHIRSWYVWEQNGKIRWGDKNNFFLNHIDKLNTLFPTAVFIHIVRDGRDVACSYRDLEPTKGLYAPTLSKSICGAAYDWQRNLKIIQTGLRKIELGRKLTIRYEDLVQYPEKTLQKVCKFLGEPYDNQMLQFAEHNRKEELEPNVFMGWKELTKSPVTKKRSGRWKREMFEEDIFLFKILAGRMLFNYQYEGVSLMPISVSTIFLRCYAFSWVGGLYFQTLWRKTRRVFGSLFRWFRKL